jgi:hypothetical protein
MACCRMNFAVYVTGEDWECQNCNPPLLVEFSGPASFIVQMVIIQLVRKFLASVVSDISSVTAIYLHSEPVLSPVRIFVTLIVVMCSHLCLDLTNCVFSALL